MLIQAGRERLGMRAGTYVHGCMPRVVIFVLVRYTTVVPCALCRLGVYACKNLESAVMGTYVPKYVPWTRAHVVIKTAVYLVRIVVFGLLFVTMLIYICIRRYTCIEVYSQV